MKTILRVFFKVILSVVLLSLVGLCVLIIFKVPVNLTSFKEPVELLVSKALDRQVRVRDSIIISTSLNPYFTVKGLVVENPQEFKTDTFLSMELARIQIQLMPLLKMKLHISEIQVEGFDLSLEQTPSGAVNWVFNSTEAADGIPAPPVDAVQQDSGENKQVSLRGDSLVIQQLNIRDLNVNYYEPNQEQPAHFQLKTCMGSMLPDKPLQLDMGGKISGFDYKIDVSLGSLEELLVGHRSWVEIETNIAKTKLSFKGDINLSTVTRSLTLEAAIQGGNLSSLNDLLQVDLPPLVSYKVETALHFQPQQIVLEQLSVKTGSSTLNGSGKIIQGENKSIIDFQLRSPLLQLDDVVFENWRWMEDEREDVVEKNKDAQSEDVITDAGSGKPKNRSIINPEFLNKFDCSLVVEAEKVLSGSDSLGSGKLHASLKEGRLKVDPLMVHLPGGKISMMASLKPGLTKSDAELKAEIENFDIGILVRRSKPESKMGGLVNLDMYLQSSASSIGDLMAAGNGYLDFSGDLENFSAGIIDLWAVNLVATILSSGTEDDSELNCAVGKWSVTDGFLRPDAFFIDTGKIRICAEGEIDLKKRRIDLKVKPHAKKPEFFSLSTPLELHGSFSDINMGIGEGGVVGSVIKFLASPVSVPLKRAFAKKIPADGSDVCNIPLGPEGRGEIIVPLCKK